LLVVPVRWCRSIQQGATLEWVFFAAGSVVMITTFGVIYHVYALQAGSVGGGRTKKAQAVRPGRVLACFNPQWRI
jgi:hypothetical protein